MSGHRTSLQLHRLRDENWYVLDGKLMVFADSDSFVLSAGETCYIPRNMRHRMIGITEARVLEISRGKFDENDIERLEDDYSRL